MGVEEIYVQVSDDAVRSSLSAINTRIQNDNRDKARSQLIHLALVLFYL